MSRTMTFGALLLASAAPATAATTHSLAFTGTVADATFDTFAIGSTILRTGRLTLAPVAPFDWPLLDDGDTVDFDVALDGLFTVPATPGLQFFGFNLLHGDDPDDPLEASNTGLIRFFQGGVQVLELGAGCGNCLSAITFQAAGAAFSFDRLTGSTTVRVSRPIEPFGASISFQVDAIPEPAAWALLIAGFGMTGGALRARRARIVYA